MQAEGSDSEPLGTTLPQEHARLPAAGEPRGQSSPRSPAPSPRRLSASRCDRPRAGEMPRFRSFQKPANCFCPQNAGRGRGAARPPSPGSRAPLSRRRRAGLARSADLPAEPASPSPRPRPPAALTSARARAGGGGVPAAHRAAAGGSGAPSRRPQVLRAETQAEGGAPRAGGPRGGARGPPPPTADGRGPGRGRPGRKPPGTPTPRGARGPRLARPSPRQPRRRPIRSLLRAPRPGIGGRSEGAGI